MKRLTVGLMAGLTLLAVLTVACGGGAPAPTAATPTLVQATATAVPPTAVPATNTPVPATSAPATTASGGAGGASGSFSTALNNAKTLTVFHMDIEMSGQGAFGAGLFTETPTAGNTPIPSSTQAITLIAVNGGVNGHDSDIKMTGLLSSFLGADPNTGLQIITVGGKSYIHGPVPLLNANEAKWYVMPAQQASAVQPSLTPSGFLDALSQGGLSPSDFSKTGSESLDNQTCDVYAANQSVMQKAFNDTGGIAGNTNNQVIDSGDLRFWICGDGYLHQVKLTAQGHSKDTPDQKGSFTMLMHITDINGNIQIQAPANAEPLNLPSFFNSGTPTP